MVRQRIVDCFHLRVGQQLFIASVGLCNAEFVRDFIGSALISGSNSDHFTPIAFLHRRDHLLDGNLSRAQNSPADFLRHSRVCAHHERKNAVAIASSLTLSYASRKPQHSFAMEHTTRYYKRKSEGARNNAHNLAAYI